MFKGGIVRGEYISEIQQTASLNNGSGQCSRKKKAIQGWSKIHAYAYCSQIEANERDKLSESFLDYNTGGAQETM